MGWWTDRVVPHIVEVALRSQPVGELRRRALAGLEGEVVEIGFGSGLNLRYYPTSVSKIYAVEPSEVARRLARSRIEASPIPVELVGLDGESLPLPDASVDAAVSTFTLCTIPAADVALAEIARVLRPGGRLHLLEHGLSDDPKVMAWQHRLNGMQQRVAGGCHLDRPVDRLVTDAGFRLERLDHPEMPGPGFMKPWGYLYLGVARAGHDGGFG
jgi:SAM-dependent methyltransferase